MNLADLIEQLDQRYGTHKLKIVPSSKKPSKYSVKCHLLIKKMVWYVQSAMKRLALK